MAGFLGKDAAHPYP